MKNAKLFTLISLVVITTALVGYSYFAQEVDNNCGEDCVLVESKQHVTMPAIENSPHNVLVQEVPEDSELISGQGDVLKQSLEVKQSIKNERGDKKHYDDDWCNAKKELSESDYQFAQTELKDWENLIGKARVRGLRTSGSDETSFPNNSFIESYEALAIDQLQALALQGDKWAMVAFLQDSRPNFREGNVVKDKIAKRLLIEGGSYYALSHLVRRFLVAAKTSIRQSNHEVAIEHVTDALAHVYWGLEHYNDGGLGTFLALTDNEFFNKHLPMESVLPNSVDKVKTKLVALTNSIDEQRAVTGIDIPEAPKAVQKMFAKDIAIRESISGAKLELLRSLDIVTNGRIASTPCVKKYIADLDELMNHAP